MAFAFFPILAGKFGYQGGFDPKNESKRPKCDKSTSLFTIRLLWPCRSLCHFLRFQMMPLAHSCAVALFIVSSNMSCMHTIPKAAFANVHLPVFSFFGSWSILEVLYMFKLPLRNVFRRFHFSQILTRIFRPYITILPRETKTNLLNAGIHISGPL